MNLAASLWATGEVPPCLVVFLFYFLQQEDISSKWSQEACSRGEEGEVRAAGIKGRHGLAEAILTAPGAARGPVHPELSQSGCYDH